MIIKKAPAWSAANDMIIENAPTWSNNVRDIMIMIIENAPTWSNILSVTS